MPAPIIYADQVVPVVGNGFGIPYSDEGARAIAQLPADKLTELAKLQADDPVTYGWCYPSWAGVIANWQQSQIHVALGGNRCLHGDTLITDPSTGESRPVKDIRGDHMVAAWNGTSVAEAFAKEPFVKARESMIRVTLGSGLGFTVTVGHEVLAGVDGAWTRAGDLKAGDTLYGVDGMELVASVVPVPGVHDVWDFEVPGYGNYVLNGVIHHNSSKSTMAARIMLWMAMNIPGARIRCWSANEESSINDQQRVIWNELPARYKNLPKKRYATYDVSYSQKNGFTGGKLILPPVEPGYDGSEIIFATYRSWANDDKVAEGWWCHGLWADEEIPTKLFETLQYRLRDANGRMILSFTTINGWTPTVQAILGKAKTLEKRYAPLVKRELPVLQAADSAKRTMVYYFWTADNIFLPMPVRNGDDMVGKPESEVLARQYGVPTKSKVAKFPLFNKDVHVVPESKIPVLKDPKKYTWYTAIDPAGSKNWFMLWGGVDASGRLWITHEWPDAPTHGEWVDNTGAEGGRPGPGQKGLGWGIRDYVDQVKAVEAAIGCEEDEVYRCIDPRMAAAEVQGEHGAETILSRLQDADMVYQPAPGKQIEDGEQLINDKLRYEPSKPIGVDNSPRLFISDKCENLVQAMELYAGTGKDEPAKDPIDALRYMLQSGTDYIDPDAPVVTGGGSY